MSFPLDSVNAMLDRASRHPFHADQVEAFLVRPDVEFAGIEPSDLTAALERAVADLASPD